MWLHLPSTSPDSVPASACSKKPSCSPSAPLGFDPVAWCMLSGKWSRRPYSWLLVRRPVTKRLSGTILQPLTASLGVASWILRLRDSRAPITLLPVSDRAMRGIVRGVVSSAPNDCEHGGPFHTSCALWEKCVPPWSFSRTSQSLSQAALFSDPQRFYADWVSSWQSPTTGGGGSFSRGGDRVGELLLGGEIQYWPHLEKQDAHQTTTTANRQSPRNNNQTGRPTEILGSARRNWPIAPQACGNHPGATDSLTGVMKNWPTPCAHAKGEPTGPSRGVMGQESLGSSVALWATPNVRDRTEKPENRKARQPNHGGKEPGGEVRIFPSSPPDATNSELGLLLSVWTPPLAPRLNPRMQWWLMGMPYQILTLCGSEATPLSQWRPQLHFMSLLEGLEPPHD